MANGSPMLCPVLYVILLRKPCSTISFLQGSDFTNIYIRSTEHPLTSAENDQRLPDELRFVKFSSIAWTHDSKGFFYQVRFLPWTLACVGKLVQRFPDRTTNGIADSEKANLVVGGDKDAQLFYHRIGTDQCMSHYGPYVFA
jgi:prolyl oligopeptidase